MTLLSCRSSATAAAPWCRGTTYSDCSSSPLLGVNASRKWGRRSKEGPETPNCSVAFSGLAPGTGFRGLVAGDAPKYGSGPSSSLVLIQAAPTAGSSQVVNRLTL